MTVTRLPSLIELMNVGAQHLREGPGSARENPRREASLLLQAAMGLPRGEMHLRRNDAVHPQHRERFLEMVEERSSGIPLQLLLGKVDFHEVSLAVEGGVFIPRPETELLVEEVRHFLGATDAPTSTGACVLDLASGTGAIAIAIASACKDSAVRVFAGDWNPRAVQLARRNARRNHVEECVDVRRSNLFSAFADLEGKVDALVSNPPYIAPKEYEDLPLEVRLGDPKDALVDPEGGTGFHQRIARRAHAFLRPGGALFLEIAESQGSRVEAILNEEGYEGVRILPDLAGRDRIARGRRPDGGGQRSLRGNPGGVDSSTRSS